MWGQTISSAFICRSEKSQRGDGEVVVVRMSVSMRIRRTNSRSLFIQGVPGRPWNLDSEVILQNPFSMPEQQLKGWNQWTSAILTLKRRWGKEGGEKNDLKFTGILVQLVRFCPSFKSRLGSSLQCFCFSLLVCGIKQNDRSEISQERSTEGAWCQSESCLHGPPQVSKGKFFIIYWNHKVYSGWMYTGESIHIVQSCGFSCHKSQHMKAQVKCRVPNRVSSPQQEGGAVEARCSGSWTWTGDWVEGWEVRRVRWNQEWWFTRLCAAGFFFFFCRPQLSRTNSFNWALSWLVKSSSGRRRSWSRGIRDDPVSLPPGCCWPVVVALHESFKIWIL